MGMRNFRSVIFALLFVVSSAGAQSINKEGIIPWPWGSEAPFPWEKIEGKWMAYNNSEYTYFAFEEMESSTSSRLLRVYQVDPYTNKRVAEGTGFETDRQVIAIMRGICGDTYRVSIRAYVDRDDRGRFTKRTVMSVGPAWRPDSWDGHYLMQKMSSDTMRGCVRMACQADR